MEKPLKFRWTLLISLAFWLLMVGSYFGGLVVWPEFTFIHTFIPSIMTIVLLTPFSSRRFVQSKGVYLMSALWWGVTIPGSYFWLRMTTGLGPHCDRVMIIMGLTAMSASLVVWAVSYLITLPRISSGCKDEERLTRVLRE